MWPYVSTSVVYVLYLNSDKASLIKTWLKNKSHETFHIRWRWWLHYRNTLGGWADGTFRKLSASRCVVTFVCGQQNVAKTESQCVCVWVCNLPVNEMDFCWLRDPDVARQPQPGCSLRPTVISQPRQLVNKLAHHAFRLLSQICRETARHIIITAERDHSCLLLYYK